MASTAATAMQRSRTSLKAGLVILATTAAVALPSRSGALAAGKTQAGRDLARQECAGCHRLPDGNGGGEARPLTAYRDQQPFTAAGLRKLIGSWPHAGNVKLPPDQAYPDLAAFLNSIDKAAASPDRGPTDRTAPTGDGPAGRRGDTNRLDRYSDGDGRKREHEEEYEDDEYYEYEDEEYYEDD